MIRLEITGETVEHFYSEAVRSLAMLMHGRPALTQPGPAPTPVEVSISAAFSEPVAASDEVSVPPEPPKSERRKPGRPKGSPLRVSQAVEAELPSNAPVETTEHSQFIRQIEEVPEKTYTREDCRDAVRQILAAHTKRGNDMPACVEYVKKLFIPFGIKQAAEIPEDRMAEFVAAAQHYIAGTVEAT